MKRLRHWLSSDNGETAFVLAMTLVAVTAMAALHVWGTNG